MNIWTALRIVWEEHAWTAARTFLPAGHYLNEGWP